MSSKFCIVRYTSVETKRSKSTQIPKLKSSLTARPKLVSIALYQKFKLDHWITQLKSSIGLAIMIYEQQHRALQIWYAHVVIFGEFLFLFSFSVLFSWGIKKKTNLFDTRLVDKR